MNADRMIEARETIRALTCWSGPVDPEPLTGGITNLNFRVRDGDKAFVVRIGEDIPLHHVLRFNELAASRAAFLAGIAPEVVHASPGVMVTRFIEGRSLTPDAVRARGFVERLVPVIHKCHRDIPRYLRGPVLTFWVFHVLRDYAARLRDEHSPYTPRLDDLVKRASRLETSLGAIDLVFTHNDMLAANLMDDGAKVWLIDWEYAGFGSPLFDLANLASNNEFSEAEERQLLCLYFERNVDDHLWLKYSAMKSASLLREAMWSMVSELHSSVTFDYATYTREYLARFDMAWRKYLKLDPARGDQ